VRHRDLVALTVPYGIAALVFYSFWVRPDPRYLAGIYLLLPLLVVAGVAAIVQTAAGLGRALSAGTDHDAAVGGSARRFAGPLLAAVCVLLLRHELTRAWLVTHTAWQAGGWRGEPALSLVSAVVAGLIVAVIGTRGTRAAPAPPRWPAVALVLGLTLVGVARAIPGWSLRASFQAPEVAAARETVESVVEPGAILLASDHVGRPAENIDYYTHAHALYLVDLRRWGIDLPTACRSFLAAGHPTYLLLPALARESGVALALLRDRFDIEHLAHVAPAQAARYFVASRFGTRALDLYRVRPTGGAAAP
jgi:hypothetical protein